MSWNSRFTRNPSEVGAALRGQRDAEDNYAQRRQQEMAGSEKSKTGITRARLKAPEAKSAVGGLNRKLDEALDEVRLAFQREAQARDTDTIQSTEDAQRAPVLGNKRGVR